MQKILQWISRTKLLTDLKRLASSGLGRQLLTATLDGNNFKE